MRTVAIGIAGRLVAGGCWEKFSNSLAVSDKSVSAVGNANVTFLTSSARLVCESSIEDEC